MARKVLGRFDVWRAIVLSDEEFDAWMDSETADEDMTEWLLGPVSVVKECDLVDMDWEPRSTLSIVDSSRSDDEELDRRILDAIYNAARGIAELIAKLDAGKMSPEAFEGASIFTATRTTLDVQRLIGDRMVYRSSLPVEELSGDPRDPDVEPTTAGAIVEERKLVQLAEISERIGRSPRSNSPGDIVDAAIGELEERMIEHNREKALLDPRDRPANIAAAEEVDG